MEFSFFINDLETSTEAGRLTTYADDTSILISGNNAREVQIKINKMINALINGVKRIV
jgi:hypothetical protein